MMAPQSGSRTGQEIGLHVDNVAFPAQGDRIWPGLPPASKDPSLRAGFGAAIQGHADRASDARLGIATSQTLLAMTERGNDGKG